MRPTWSSQAIQSAAYARAGQEAKAAGHRALRVAADMSPAVTDARALRRLIAYELAVDTVVATQPLITLCGYDVHRIGTPGRAVIAAHPARCGTDVPPFTVACRDERITISGEVEVFDAVEFGEALEAAALVVDDPLHLDLSELHFSTPERPGTWPGSSAPRTSPVEKSPSPGRTDRLDCACRSSASPTTRPDGPTSGLMTDQRLESMIRRP